MRTSPTGDPCFDAARNLDCFGGERDEWETIAWACGEIEIGAEDGARFTAGQAVSVPETQENGLVRVHDGGWVISIMARDMPQIAGHPEIGEDLISSISLQVFNAWGPVYQQGESQ